MACICCGGEATNSRFCPPHGRLWNKSGEKKRAAGIPLRDPHQQTRLRMAMMDFATRITAEERNEKIEVKGAGRAA